MFIMMKTVARTVEKDRIHLKRHLIYVNKPAKRAKNEYHRRVSPIVLSGGLSRPIHISMMNAAIDASEAEAEETAAVLRRLYRDDEADQWSLAQTDTTAATAENRMAVMPNHMKLSHVIISFSFITSCWSSYEKKQSTGNHHDDSDDCCIFPRFTHYFEDAVL